MERIKSIALLKPSNACLRKIPPVERQLDDAPVLNDRTERRVFGSQQRRRRAHLHSFGFLSDVKLKVETRFLLKLQNDATPHLGPEAGSRARDFVFADVEDREDIVARLIGARGTRVAGLDSPGGNSGVGDPTPLESVTSPRICLETV
jgi:hypothetical protein